MAIHTHLRGRHTCKRRCFYGGVAITTVDSIVHDVVFVTERDWLVDGPANIRDIRRAYVQLEDREKKDNAKQRAPQGEASQTVRAWAKDLSHCALTVWRPREGGFLICVTKRDRRVAYATPTRER